MKKSPIILLSFMIISILLAPIIVGESLSEQKSIRTPSCTDSDNGNFKKIPGFVTTKNFFGLHIYQDKCDSEKQKEIEYSCNDKKIERNYHFCNNGCNSQKTACKQEEFNINPNLGNPTLKFEEVFQKAEEGDTIVFSSLTLKLEEKSQKTKDFCSLFSISLNTPNTIRKLQGSGSGSGIYSETVIEIPDKSLNQENIQGICSYNTEFFLEKKNWISELPEKFQQKARDLQNIYDKHCTKEINNNLFSLTVCQTPNQNKEADTGLGALLKLKIELGKKKK